MVSDTNSNAPLTSKALLGTLVRFGLILAMAGYCLKVFTPFAGIMIWGLLLAISLYPLHQKIARRLGNRQGRTSTIMVLVTVAGIGVPLFFLGNAFVAPVLDLHSAITDNTLQVNPPKESVAEWPIVGEKVYNAWSSASTSMSDFLEQYNPQIRDFSKRLFSTSAGILGSVLQLLVSFIVAGIIMAYGEDGQKAMARIYNRIVGREGGEILQKLCTATVRSVAVGVLGVAFLQALLFGVGFIISGIPAAGILALIALFLGIIQIPALVVGLPAIAYIWSMGEGSTTLKVVFTLYFVVASLADNVLKPMLLGRGVEAPMPVILIGALGGMVASGFIGLFIGAVVLAVGYRVFMAWVSEEDFYAATHPKADSQSD